MRFAFDSVSFSGCNITSSFQTLLKCPLAKFWSIGIYQALLAAQNEPIILSRYEKFGDLAQTISGLRNSSETFYDKLLNGHVDAAMTSLLMVESLAPYRIPTALIFLRKIFSIK